MPNLPKPKHIVAGLGLAASIAFYFMQPEEGTRYVAYQDSGGVWTICKGHTPAYQGEKADDTKCDYLYKQDILVAEKKYESMVYKVQHPNVKAACLSFIFNTGAKDFRSSHLRKYLNDGNREKACHEFPRFAHVKGKPCEIRSNNCYGVYTRRKNEMELCLSNVLSVCDFYSGVCRPDFVGPAQPVNP